MPRRLALLRAVNLGGVNKIPMAELRIALEQGGLRHVETYLQSGNVLFEADGSPEENAACVESVIRTSFGHEIPVLVRGREDLARVVEANALADIADNPSRYAVVFLSAPAAAELASALDPSAYEPDVFAFSGREMYIWYPNGIHESKLTVSLIERRLQVTATARNWNTVTTLLEKLGE